MPAKGALASSSRTTSVRNDAPSWGTSIDVQRMSSDFDQRLTQILGRITADDFLKGCVLGSEIPFYAFDYPPEQELAVRAHIAFVLAQVHKQRQQGDRALLEAA